MSPVCSKCGFNNESESKFCKNCGNLLSEDIVNSFEIESGREFSKKAIQQFRAKLEEISNKKGIKYTYFKKPPLGKILI